MSSSPYKSLGKNTIIFALGTFGSKAISFFMLPVFTRVLTQADYGKIDIITTSISLLLPLVTLNIVEAVFRFTLDKGTMEQKQEVFSSALVVGTAGFLCLLLFIPVFVHFSVSGSLLLAFLALFFIDIVHGITKVLIRAEQRLRLFAISDIIHTAVFASTGIILVAVLKMGVIGYLIAQIISVSVATTILSLFGQVWSYARITKISMKRIKTLVGYSLPLVVSSLSWWAVNASDRYLLAFLLGIEAAGVYGIAHRFPLIVTIFSDIFYQAWQISSIQEYRSHNSQTDAFYSSIFKMFYTFMFLMLGLVSLFIKPLVTFVVGSEFVEAWRFVPLLMIGVVFQSFCSFYGVGYLASKRTRGAMSTTLISAGFNIAIDFFLIPVIGIQAASFSTAIAFIGMWVMRLFQTRSYFQIRIQWRHFLLLAGLSVFCMVIILFRQDYFILQVSALIIMAIAGKSAIVHLFKGIFNETIRRRELKRTER